MGVVIRLQRAGARNRPFYRVVVTDSRKPRDGAFLEKVGYYDPLPANDVIHLDRERLTHWMAKGAKPSEAVHALIRRLEKRGGMAASDPAAPDAAALENTAPEGAAKAVGETAQGSAMAGEPESES
ncbi:MAG: 30S ribosomal protein S16 [Candidatus Eisenbacteria sp.]|nr:30S ribosomal protein S16 [Candidatus Eisenbacteria bacterium]